MRDFSYFATLLGLVFWGLAFYSGPESGFWKLGKPGLFMLAVAVLFFLVDYLIPSKRPKRRHKVRSETARKCSVCGKPALSGSQFCSYHAKYGSDGENR